MVEKDIRMERGLRGSSFPLKKKYSPGPATLEASGSLLEIWALRLTQDLLNQEADFKEVPRYFVCTVGFKKPWSRTVVLKTCCMLELPGAL